MQQPHEPAGVLELLQAYWQYITALCVGIGAVFGVYRKYLKGVPTRTFVWFKLVIQTPVLISQMRADMVLRDEFNELHSVLKQMQARIVTETASRRGLLQHMDKAIFEADSHGRLLWANGAYLSLVDRDLHEIKDNNWRTVIHDLDRALAVEAWRTAIDDQTDYRFRFRVVTDRKEFWVQAEALCNKDELGNVLSYAGELRTIEDPRSPKSAG